MNNKPLVALVGCLVVGTASAIGTYGEAIPKTDAAVRFDRLDKDKDGYLTREELDGQPSINAEFPRLDSNGDGKLDDSEFSAFEQAGDSQSTPR